MKWSLSNKFQEKVSDESSILNQLYADILVSQLERLKLKGSKCY